MGEPVPRKNKLRVGQRLYFVDQLHHVRGFVDDMVVMRHWNPRKQRFDYTAEPRWVVEHQRFYSSKRTKVDRG